MDNLEYVNGLHAEAFAMLAEENARLRDALEKAEQQLDYGQIDAAHRIILAALKPENPNA